MHRNIVVKLIKSLNRIEDKTFQNMSGLKSIIIPNSVTYIGKKAFKKSAITKITLPKNLIYIGIAAFENCEELTEIVIPETVEFIGEDAFKFLSVNFGHFIENSSNYNNNHI